jgi:RNA polymerase sigma-70 factor (ECF subfamily)
MTDDRTALAEHVAAARATWPTLTWTDADYVAWLTEIGADAAKLAASVPGEVVLCWAAGRGDPDAQRLFEQQFISQIPAALRRFNDGPSLVDEVAQRMRVKLLVAKAPGAMAPIADYAFGGSLAGLVRVAAVREALSLRRGDKPQAPPETIDELPGELDPVLRSLKAKYATEFQRAFVAAANELSSKDRELLRLSLSVKASIDDIARIYQTHRATAARWLTSARDALAENTRRHLQQQLKLQPDELTSLLRLVRTEATRMLATIPPRSDD